MLEFALKYAEKGFHVFPLIPGWKTPVESGGFHTATTDINKIKKWWKKNPNYNIGIRCGFKYNVLCLDIDNKKDKNGFTWLKAQEDLPITAEQVTPSGGMQYLFKAPEEYIKCSSDEIAEGIDIRGDGGYFVAPPSKIFKRDGYPYDGEYIWNEGQSITDLTLPIPPEWLLNEIRTTSTLSKIEKDDSKEFLPIMKVVNHYNLKLTQLKNGDLVGAHPIHGSSNGMNFRVCPSKNVWACYRHKSTSGNFVGGGSIHLVALLEGILQCEECVPKSLTGDRFKRTIKIIENKLGISRDMFKQHSLELIVNEIKELKNISDKWEVVSQLKVLAKKISTLPKEDIISVTSIAKETLKLKSDDIKALKISIDKCLKDRVLNKNKSLNLDLDQNLMPKISDKNLLTILEKDLGLKQCFKYNEFSGEIDVDYGEWAFIKKGFPRQIKNNDIHQIKRYIIDKFNMEYKKNTIEECISSTAVFNSYDPLLDYLDSLKWDGVPRLKTWLHDYCGVERNDYTEFISQLMLVAAVKRGYEEGCKYDHVIVLAGEQGVLKSTLINTLGGKWSIPISLVDKNKDTIQKMKGAWFIELPEGIPFSKKDINELKSFITEEINKERFAYEKFHETHKRRSIFIMTINPDTVGYLKDTTGNRRFLPVRIGKNIDIESIKKIKNQLFAEAKHLYNKGFKTYISKEDENIINGLKAEHDIAEIKDGWQDKIIDWLINSYDLPDKMSIIYIWENCFKAEASKYIPQNHGVRIGNIMRDLGCDLKDCRVKNVKMKRFFVKDLIKNLRKESNEEMINEASEIVDF